MKLGAKLSVIVAVIVVAGLALPVSNMVIGGPSATALTRTKTDDAQLVRVTGVLEKRCAYCHVAGTGRPFYAALPVASSLIERDVQDGLGAANFEAELFPQEGVLVSEPFLARMEREIVGGAMPPARFLAMHWDGRISGAEQDTVMAWVYDTRARVHALPGVPERLRRAVVRPLPANVEVNPAKAALGEKLYNDKRLSGDDTISCATCHDLAKGGTDREKVSTGIRGQKGGINAPTTFNAAFQFKQFWDGRAATLADQAAGPPANPIEMGATWEGIVGKLGQDAALVAEFQAIYPEAVTKNNVTDAIAEFERTLITPGAKLDKYLLGDVAALNAEEKKGYELFLNKGCATCHVGELLGGKSFDLLGRRADYFAVRGNLTDADNGRLSVTKAEADRHRFKVPTLRNVALTAPYFHDATQATLKDATTAMARFQLGEEMGQSEIAALVKFLEALTGELHGKPL
jgi:cytochrome c peroxidase